MQLLQCAKQRAGTRTCYDHSGGETPTNVVITLVPRRTAQRSADTRRSRGWTRVANQSAHLMRKGAKFGHTRGGRL